MKDTPTTAEELRDAKISPRVVEAIVALTDLEADSYEDYVEVVATNELARTVKLADLADNLATNRSLPPSPANLARIERYEAAIGRLAPLS